MFNWAPDNDVEKRYGMPLTPIYAITSMASDTISSMSGEHGGFQGLLSTFQCLLFSLRAPLFLRERHPMGVVPSNKGR